MKQFMEIDLGDGFLTMTYDQGLEIERPSQKMNNFQIYFRSYWSVLDTIVCPRLITGLYRIDNGFKFSFFKFI